MKDFLGFLGLVLLLLTLAICTKGLTITINEKTYTIKMAVDK